MPYKVPRHTGLAAYPALERARASAMEGAARRAARALERQGRGGDRHLVHVNDRELAAIRGAFGPGGGIGRRNPVTGLESFAPDEETNVGDTFVGANPDGSGYTVRPPLDTPPAGPAAAAEFNLMSINPTALGQTTTIANQKGRSDGSPSSGLPVVLPNGEELRVHVPPDDREVPLYSPVPDLSDVAQTGKRIGQVYRSLLGHPSTTAIAPVYLLLALGFNHGQGGAYDYQREGNLIQGYRQFPQFPNVANFNIGLSLQQAGLPLDDALRIAGLWARVTSSNANPDDPYSPNSQNAALMRQGYDVGEKFFSEPSSP